MLSELYTLYDNLIDKYQLYKVTTLLQFFNSCICVNLQVEVIGDAYIVASGLKNCRMDPVTTIVNLTFEIRDKSA